MKLNNIEFKYITVNKIYGDENYYESIDHGIHLQIEESAIKNCSERVTDILKTIKENEIIIIEKYVSETFDIFSEDGQTIEVYDDEECCDTQITKDKFINRCSVLEARITEGLITFNISNDEMRGSGSTEFSTSYEELKTENHRTNGLS